MKKIADAIIYTLWAAFVLGTPIQIILAQLLR